MPFEVTPFMPYLTRFWRGFGQADRGKRGRRRSPNREIRQQRSQLEHWIRQRDRRFGPVEQRSAGLLLSCRTLLGRGQHLDEAEAELNAVVEILDADTFVLAMSAIVVELVEHAGDTVGGKRRRLRRNLPSVAPVDIVATSGRPGPHRLQWSFPWRCQLRRREKAGR